MKIYNIPYKEYYTIKDRREYDYTLKFGIFSPVDIFQLGNFFDCSFGFVKDMQENLSDAFFTWDDYIKEINKYKKISLSEIAGHGIFDIHRSILYCQEQINAINENEAKFLGHIPTAEEVEAGCEIFDKYKSFIQFDSLTGGDITKINLIREMPYSECFLKLMYDSDLKAFETNLFNIRNRPK